MIIQIRPARIKIKYCVDQTYEMIPNEDIESRNIRVVRREEEGDEENTKPKITPAVRKGSRSVFRKQKYTMSESKKRKSITSPKRSFKRKTKKSPHRSPSRKKTMKRLSILNEASDDDGSESDTEPLDFEEPPAWLLGL